MLKSLFLSGFLLTLWCAGAPSIFALDSDPAFTFAAAAPLKCLAPDPFSPGHLFAASEHELFQRGSGLSWRNVGSIETGSDGIHRFFAESPQSLFLTTGRAVYRFEAAQNKLEKIFEHRSETGSSVFSFALWDLPVPLWTAGTSDGLFISADQGKTWSHSALLPAQVPVVMTAAVEQNLFLIAGRTLYKAVNPRRIRPVFILPGIPAGDESPETAPEFEEESTAEIYRPQLIPAGKDTKHLWLSTENGVAESRDGGNQWHMLPLSGLEDTQVRALAYAEKSAALFAGTRRGIYVYSEQAKRWRLFSRSAPQNDGTLAVTAEKEEMLAAISDGRIVEHRIQPESLFSHTLWLVSPEKEKMFESLTFFEPTVRELHRAVIRFGNLSSEKIRRWQRESRLRALLPSLSVGRDFSDHNTIDLDRGGTADPDRYILGPDSHTRGSDMSVSWSLGDLIWDTAQTSIDTREKLMIDQRRDFLAEATRIFYERRRLQAEILYTDPETPEVSPLYDKQIRLDELTAQLDALTGGWMSERLEKVYDEHPEIRGFFKSPRHQVTSNP